MAEKQLVRISTKAEAEERRDKINAHGGAMAALVREQYYTEGWRALGYASWTDYVSKEHAMGRARIAQLLDEAKIADELKDAGAGLSSKAIRALKDVPAGQRQAALDEAKEESGGKPPTSTQVKKAAAAWRPSGAKPKKVKVLSLGEQAADNPKLKQALINLGDTCGRNFRKAVEDGTVELTKNEVIEMAGLEDDTMKEVEKLVSVNGWTVKRALKFLGKMPSLSDPIETLVNLAIASLDDEWKGDFGAVTIVATVHRRKL